MTTVLFRTLTDHIYRVTFDEATNAIFDYDLDVDITTVNKDNILFGIPVFIDPHTHIGQQNALTARNDSNRSSSAGLISTKMRAEDSITNYGEDGRLFSRVGYRYCAISPGSDMIVGGSICTCDIYNRYKALLKFIIKPITGVKAAVGENIRIAQGLTRMETFVTLRNWCDDIVKKTPR